jgi:hypothetical protein
LGGYEKLKKNWARGLEKINGQISASQTVARGLLDKSAGRKHSFADLLFRANSSVYDEIESDWHYLPPGTPLKNASQPKEPSWKYLETYPEAT